MTARLTNKEWLKRAASAPQGNEYIWLDEYVNANTKLRYKHIVCGRTSSIRPYSFLSGCRCRFCAIENSRITFEDWVKRAKKMPQGAEYTWEKPDNFDIKKSVTVFHSVCGKKTRIQPGHFSEGHRCKVCSDRQNGKNRRRTNAQWIKDAGSQPQGNEYAWLEPYVTTNTKILAKHLTCGFTYKVAPAKFLLGRRCPKCFGHIQHDNEWWQAKAKQQPQADEYEWLGRYSNYDGKILVRHIVCGKEFRTSPGNFIRGSRCPFCASPKGELLISDWLIDKDIAFVYQKSFPGLVGSKKLMSFDFYIPDTKTAIEYNGIQHYEPVTFFGGINKYKNQVEHDNAKALFCLSRGIRLVVLPYWDTADETISKLEKEVL